MIGNKLSNLESDMNRIGNLEQKYKDLYLQCPSAYEKPIKSWEELICKIDNPVFREPPSAVKEYLSEKEFFVRQDMDINCFTNLRYCPAFLHKLEFIKIVYCIKGKSVFFLDGKEYDLYEGSFCIVSPGVEQAVWSGSDESIVVNLLMKASTFKEEFGTVLMEHGIITDFFWQMSYTQYCNRVLFAKCKPDNMLKRIVLMLLQEINYEKNPSNLIAKSYVGMFIGECIRSHSLDVFFLEGLEQKVYRIPKVLGDMRDNLSSINLEELAAKWHMKESQISLELKLETGYSFNQLLLDLRLQRASALLEKTTKSIEEIMDEVGLGDSAAFYRSFKKRYGLTPAAYRERVPIYKLI